MQTKFFICFALYAVCVDSQHTVVGQAGKDIKVPCHDKIGAIVWKVNGTVVISVDKSGRSTKGSHDLSTRVRVMGTALLISESKPEDSGTFTCLLTVRDSNKRTQTLTQDSILLVRKVSVSVDPGSPLLQPAAAKLTCDVSGSPNSVTLEHEKKPYTGRTLQLERLEHSPAGKWTCKAHYKEGVLEDSLDIAVIGLTEQVNPVSVKQGQKAVLPCSLTTSNFGSLNVVGGGWKSPPNVDGSWLPSLDTSNSKELRWKGDPSKKVTFPKEKLGTNLNITLLKVTPQLEGRYQCYIEFKDRGTLTEDVTLEVGGGGSVPPPDTYTDASLGKTIPSWLGLNVWIWVGVGAGSVVIIGLVIAIVLVHRSNRRKKMRMRRLKSVRKPLTPNDYCQCNRQPRGDYTNQPARGPRRIPENIQINGGHGRRPRM